MKKILVTGGAGYIGSHMVYELLEKGYQPIVFDSLVTGYREAIPKECEFVQGDLGDKKLLADVFNKFSIDAVMHFAAFIQVGESVTNPRKYYDNNFIKTVNLLDTMLDCDVNNFIFSSTAAVFGDPDYVPIDEAHSIHPVNSYGESKAMVETVLKDYEEAYGLHSISLRYFNAAGAHPNGKIGPRLKEETHLIPLVLQAAAGERDHITVFGTDYDTPDGTCVRDYIHVCDLCGAHLLALEYLWNEKRTDVFNLGNGNGYSVKEIVDVATQVTQKSISIVEGERRPGDAGILVADASKAKKVLKWQPKYSSPEIIVQHAWAWEQNYSNQ